MPESYSMVMETVCNAAGEEVEKRNFAVPKSHLRGQGFPIDSYRPEKTNLREMYVKWSFEPVLNPFSPAVAGITSLFQDKSAFPFGKPEDIGAPSYEWPEDSRSKQKLAKLEKFDRLDDKKMWEKGAHMPLMIFVGANRDSRRSPKSWADRSIKADQRGWNRERRRAHDWKCNQQPYGADSAWSQSNGWYAYHHPPKGQGRGQSKGDGKGRRQVWQQVSR